MYLEDTGKEEEYEQQLRATLATGQTGNQDLGNVELGKLKRNAKGEIELEFDEDIEGTEDLEDLDGKFVIDEEEKDNEDEGF